jgi:hypothetical protein
MSVLPNARFGDQDARGYDKSNLKIARKTQLNKLVFQIF